MKQDSIKQKVLLQAQTHIKKKDLRQIQKNIRAR